MGWFDILKVEDIAFDGDIDAFGQYTFTNADAMDASKIYQILQSGKRADIMDLMTEKIRINHKKIYRYLKEKLDREPTEKEISEFTIRAIMHEATHAGMGVEQANMDEAAKEYGAFTGQFPDNIFYRIKLYLDHPMSERVLLPPIIANLLEINGKVSKESVKELTKFVGWVEYITDRLNVDSSTKDKIKHKLAKLEVTARTQKPRETFSENLDPINSSTWIKRYGEEHASFLRKLKNSSDSFSDEELKMAGAVTTGSAPAMFNKVVRGRRKRRKKDE